MLIDLLDQRDAAHEDLEPEFDDDLDEDLEREPDEASLGAPENHHDQRHWAQGGALFGVDLEDQDEDGTVLDRGEGDLSDLEPSLGATEFICQQIAWSAAETPWGPDIEDVNEGSRDDYRKHEGWFTRQVEAVGGANV